MRWSERPSLFYRLIRRALRLLAAVLFRVKLVGLENAPRAGAIVCAVPHRNWVEPVLLMALMPARPRLTVIAEGRTVSKSVLRRFVIRAGGGVIPITPGPAAASFEWIAASAAEVVRAGAILVIFPETGPPARAPQLRELSRGVAHLAARTGAPVMPVIFGGNHELYLRRRIVVRVHESIAAPSSTSRADIDAWMRDFRATVSAAADAAHADAEADPPRRKRWRWLTGKYPQA